MVSKYCGGTHEGALFWINNEICGMICGLVTWGFLFFGQYATSYSIIIPWLGYTDIGISNLVVFNIIAILALASHFRAMTTDPGAVPKCAIPLASDTEEREYEAQDRVNGNKFKKYCKRCDAYKPYRAHHCSVCRRCIIKMDHHCPWLNNCVGIGNHKLFLQFIFWICVMSCYSLVLNICRYVNCLNDGRACGSVIDHTLSMLVFLESILFALFTVCMMCDQWPTVMTNQTQIDRMKQLKPESRTVHFNEVFGSDHSVFFRPHFLLPIPVQFPPALKDEIMGYTVPTGHDRLSYDKYNDEIDGSQELTPLTSMEEGGVMTPTSQQRGSQRAPEPDLAHMFNSPGGFGASSGGPQSHQLATGQALPRPLSVQHSGTGNVSLSYESKEDEELLSEIDRRSSSHILDDGQPKKNMKFTSIFPSFASTYTGSLLSPPPRKDSEPPSSPSKESPHRVPASETDPSTSSVSSEPSSATSSIQESLNEGRNIFMRKRPSNPQHP